MHQPQRPVEKGEDRVKDALGGFLGAGLEEVHITSPTFHWSDLSRTVLPGCREGCETESPPGVLASNNSQARAHEGNRNLWQLVARLCHIMGSKTDHSGRGGADPTYPKSLWQAQPYSLQLLVYILE